MKTLSTVLLLVATVVLLIAAVSCGEASVTTAATTTTAITSTTPDTTTEAVTTTTPPATTESTAKPDPDMSPVSATVNIYAAFKSQSFTSSEGVNLPYRIFLPKDYNEAYSYPVLLFLHGAGERGTDNRNQLNNVIAKLYEDKSSPFYHTIVIVPQCPNDEQWVNTPWSNGNYNIKNVPISQPLTAAVELLDSMLETYSINPDRQYVMGISMGGYGTWDLLMRYPERFAAAIPICGAADRTQASLLVNMPIWTFHDTTDTTVPSSGTKLMVNAIKNAGGELIKYTETSQYGHGVWDSAVATDGLFDWLFAQRKDKVE